MGKWILVAAVVLLLVVVFYLGFRMNSPVSFSPVPVPQQVEGLQQSPIDRFATSDLHWDHMPITYNVDSCADTFEGKLAKDIDKALFFITSRTEGAVSFEKAQEGSEADITYICDIGALETKNARGQESGFITEAEAVPFTYQGTSIYAPSEIYIYATYPCLGKNIPATIVHETLHMLGLKHNTNPSNPGDVMQPYLSQRCDLDIQQKDVDYLREIYS